MDTEIFCIQGFVPSLQFSWESFLNLLNSNFSAAIAGAAAGAYGAHYIAERAKFRQEVLAEIRNTNVAITVVVGISQSLLSLKKQVVKPFMEDYQENHRGLTAFKEAQSRGEVPPGVAFSFQADFRSIAPASVPQAALQELVFNKLTWSGRPLILTNTFNRCIDGLTNSILERNALLEKLKPLVNAPEILAPLYFGIPGKDGHTNSQLPDLLRAIYDQTDDAIFFINLLYQDLREHGETLLASLKRKPRGAAPTIHRLEYTDPETQSLLPDENKYKDWLTNFPKSKPKRSWFARKLAQLIAIARKGARQYS